METSLVEKLQNTLDPTVDLVKDGSNQNRQRLQYRKYIPSWRGRSLVEEYSNGNMAVVLDLVARDKSNVERAVPLDSVGVQILGGHPKPANEGHLKTGQ
jgi:hypothetical protein